MNRTLSAVLLAMLYKEKYLSGYNITKQLTPITGHSHQQVYRELTQLVKKGLIDYKVQVNDGKPDSKLYFVVGAKQAAVAAMIGVDTLPKATPTDFGKTPSCYTLLVEDVLNGTDKALLYINHMAKAEELLMGDRLNIPEKE